MFFYIFSYGHQPIVLCFRNDDFKTPISKNSAQQTQKYEKYKKNENIKNNQTNLKYRKQIEVRTFECGPGLPS